MIERGYERRHRHLWSAIRWQTYNLMQAQAGSDALRKAGVNTITDLITFPWEKQHRDLPTDDEVASMLNEMNAINLQRQSSFATTGATESSGR